MLRFKSEYYQFSLLSIKLKEKEVGGVLLGNVLKNLTN